MPLSFVSLMMPAITSARRCPEAGAACQPNLREMTRGGTTGHRSYDPVGVSGYASMLELEFYTEIRK